MPKPYLMPYKDWISKTSSVGHKRSQDLQNVDLYLQDYHTSPQWPQMLRQLEVNLTQWVSSKTKAGGTLDTVRDHKTVRLLQQQVAAARTLPVPTPWDSKFPGISIAQDPFAGDLPVPDNFSARVQNNLGDLISKDRGKLLMALISRGCEDRKHEVVIQCNPVLGGANQCAPVDVAITSDLRRGLSELGKVSLPGLLAHPSIVATIKVTSDGSREFVPNKIGANAVVKYNPDDKGEGGKGGGFIGLAHELIHAYHYVYGLCARSPIGGASGDYGLAEEEMRTVGARAYKDEVPSENWIREEWKLPLRTTYSGYDFSDTTATGSPTTSITVAGTTPTLSS